MDNFLSNKPFFQPSIERPKGRTRYEVIRDLGSRGEAILVDGAELSIFTAATFMNAYQNAPDNVRYAMDNIPIEKAVELAKSFYAIHLNTVLQRLEKALAGNERKYL